jgi:hypothetical protein
MEIRLRVHDRQSVALVILPGDLVIAEDLAGRPDLAVGRHSVLVRDVIIVAENAVLLEPRFQKKWYSSSLMPLSMRYSNMSESTRLP